MQPKRPSPNEVTIQQLQQGIDFDEDEGMPGDEASRARQPQDPEEHIDHEL
jgi:hypothetical protein